MKKILFLVCLLLGVYSFSQELNVVKISSKASGEKLVSNSTISINKRSIEINIEGDTELNDVKIIYEDKNKITYELATDKNVRFTYIKDGKNHLLVKKIKFQGQNKIDEFYYFLE